MKPTCKLSDYASKPPAEWTREEMRDALDYIRANKPTEYRRLVRLGLQIRNLNNARLSYHVDHVDHIATCAQLGASKSNHTN